MSKRFVIIIAVGILTLTAFWSMMKTDAEKQDIGATAEPGVTVGKLSVDFSLPTLEGRSVTISNKNSQVTVINFWATWCPPCREEMPELNSFAEQRRSIAFYAVNIQESPDKVAAFMKQNKYNMTVLLDKDGAVARLYRVNAIPTTIVIDRKGIIRYRKSGTVTLKELDEVIKSLGG